MDNVLHSFHYFKIYIYKLLLLYYSGSNICDECSAKKFLLTLVNPSEPSRVCNNCYVKLCMGGGEADISEPLPEQFLPAPPKVLLAKSIQKLNTKSCNICSIAYSNTTLRSPTVCQNCYTTVCATCNQKKYDVSYIDTNKSTKICDTCYHLFEIGQGGEAFTRHIAGSSSDNPLNTRNAFSPRSAHSSKSTPRVAEVAASEIELDRPKYAPPKIPESLRSSRSSSNASNNALSNGLASPSSPLSPSQSQSKSSSSSRQQNHPPPPPPPPPPNGSLRHTSSSYISKNNSILSPRQTPVQSSNQPQFSSPGLFQSESYLDDNSYRMTTSPYYANSSSNGVRTSKDKYVANNTNIANTSNPKPPPNKPSKLIDGRQPSKSLDGGRPRNVSEPMQISPGQSANFTHTNPASRQGLRNTYTAGTTVQHAAPSQNKKNSQRKCVIS